MEFTIRRARPADAAAMADAHLDSIRSIGPEYYPTDVVAAWAEGLTGRLYLDAMRHGEIFFIALERSAEERQVLGFSSHRVDDNVHGVSVYVRGSAARRGVGSALIREAEAAARAAGATAIQIDASLGAVEFYETRGYEETGRGMHRLPSGAAMACVFMRKVFHA